MNNRHPSTPPPTGHESIDPFFTTPMKGSMQSTSKVSTHSRGKSFNNSDNNTSRHTTTANTSTINNNVDNTVTKKDIKANHSSVLFTPQTPCVSSSYDDEYYNSKLLPLSPQTSKKNNPTIDVFNRHSENAVNPLRTPETTPRHFHRKRDTNESLNLDSLTNKTLFTNSRRTGSTYLESTKRGLLEFRSSIKINIEKGKEVYAEEDDGEDEEEVKTEEDKIRDDREEVLMNYSSSEYDSDEEKNRRLNILKRKINFVAEYKEDKTFPVTPPNQIMTEELILKKYGVEKCKFAELGEDLKEVNNDLNHNKFEGRKILNPFIKQKKGGDGNNGNVGKKVKFNPRFENEIEMVYNPTGEKFFVKLSETGQKIRPKRLNFDEFNYLEEDNEKELLKTPEFQSENKMSIRGLLNHEDCDDGVILEEGVRFEKIHNPFRGNNSNTTSNSNNGGKAGTKGMKGLQELEMINHTTGQRRTEQVEEEDMVLQPRKLTFE